MQAYRPPVTGPDDERAEPSVTEGVETAAGSPFEVYRRLVDAVPPGRPLVSCVAGLVWTLAQVGDASGLAATLPDGVHDSELPGALEGMEARRLAARINGWNMFEACLALATVNACCNRPESVARLLGRPLVSGVASGLFERLSRRFQGARVAVVGRYPHLEPLAERCRLVVLERAPSGDDLPDQACEYVLGQQDCVVITASAIVNKTLPRLLELSRHAYVVLAGPGVPLVPLWFDYGVDLLAGTVVLDPERLSHAIRQGAHRHGFGDSVARAEIAAERGVPSR